jgi:hypothetical protein
MFQSTVFSSTTKLTSQSKISRKPPKNIVISEFLGGGGTATGVSEVADGAGAVLVQDLDCLESIKCSEYKQKFT